MAGPPAIAFKAGSRFLINEVAVSSDEQLPVVAPVLMSLSAFSRTLLNATLA